VEFWDRTSWRRISLLKGISIELTYTERYQKRNKCERK
jgi:hypothetical protein